MSQDILQSRNCYQVIQITITNQSAKKIQKTRSQNYNKHKTPKNLFSRLNPNFIEHLGNLSKYSAGIKADVFCNITYN